MGPGSVIEVIEEEGGIQLKVVRAIPKQNIAALAGMVKAVSKGKRRSLDDFDAAALLLVSLRLIKSLPNVKRHLI